MKKIYIYTYIIYECFIWHIGYIQIQMGITCFNFNVMEISYNLNVEKQSNACTIRKTRPFGSGIRPARVMRSSCASCDDKPWKRWRKFRGGNVVLCIGLRYIMTVWRKLVSDSWKVLIVGEIGKDSSSEQIKK
jgi:hypothetical protein